MKLNKITLVQGLVVSGIAVMSASSVNAASIKYNVNLSEPCTGGYGVWCIGSKQKNMTVKGTITTDGKIGELSKSNVKAWSLDFSSPSYPTANINSVNNILDTFEGVDASPTALTVDLTNFNATVTFGSSFEIGVPGISQVQGLSLVGDQLHADPMLFLINGYIDNIAIDELHGNFGGNDQSMTFPDDTKPFILATAKTTPVPEPFDILGVATGIFLFRKISTSLKKKKAKLSNPNKLSNL